MAREAKLLIVAENLAKAAISDAKGDLQGFEAASKKVGDTLKSAFAITAVLAALEKLASGALDCIKEFGDMDRTMTQLKSALGGNEVSFGKMTDLIDEMAGKTLESKDAIEKMVAELASMGKSDADIERITKAAVALSNVTGKDLNASMLLINGTFDGTAGKLSKLIPEIGDMTKAQLESGNAIDLINQKFGAVSDSMANGITQKMKNLGDAMKDIKENIGRALVPAFTPLVEWLSRVAEGWGKAAEKANSYNEASKKSAADRGIDDQLALTQHALDDLNTKMNSVNLDLVAPEKLKALLDQQRSLMQTISGLLQSKQMLATAAGRIPSSSSGTSSGSGTSTSTPAYDDSGFYSAHAETQHPMWAQDAADMGKFSDAAAEAGQNLDYMYVSTFSLNGMAQKFKEGWGTALDSLKAKAEDWSGTLTAILSTLQGAMVDALGAIGEALASGDDGWSNMGKVALEALSGILKAIAAQLAAMAVIEAVKLNFAGAAIAAAGAVAAGIGAGVASYYASTMSGTSATTASDSGSSGSGSGASYTGAQSITLNFFNQGNVVGSGGLKELAYLLKDIIDTDARYA